MSNSDTYNGQLRLYFHLVEIRWLTDTLRKPISQEPPRWGKGVKSEQRMPHLINSLGPSLVTSSMNKKLKDHFLVHNKSLVMKIVHRVPVGKKCSEYILKNIRWIFDHENCIWTIPIRKAGCSLGLEAQTSGYETKIYLDKLAFATKVLTNLQLKLLVQKKRLVVARYDHNIPTVSCSFLLLFEVFPPILAPSNEYRIVARDDESIVNLYNKLVILLLILRLYFPGCP